MDRHRAIEVLITRMDEDKVGITVFLVAPFNIARLATHISKNISKRSRISRIIVNQYFVVENGTFSNGK